MTSFDRREFLRISGAIGAGSLLAKTALGKGQINAPATQGIMGRFPEKTEMILLTDRPPQLETPIKYFRQDLTPNDAFFVRWHLSGIPTRVDLKTFRLEIAGHVEKALSLSVDELKRDFEPVSVVAVAQCS